MTLGQRIREALKHWNDSHRAFAREMQERGVRGGSYRSLVNYLNGETTPSTQWLEEAAEIMGVNFQWLATGEGPMEPKGRTTVDEHGVVDPIALFEACAPAWFQGVAGDLIVAAWFDAVRTTIQGTEDMARVREEQDVLHLVGRWMIVSAVHHMQRLRGGDWSRRQLNHYFPLFFHAMAAAAPDPGEGKSVDQLRRLLEADLEVAEGRAPVEEDDDAQE